jgi:hypothetical protein
LRQRFSTPPPVVLDPNARNKQLDTPQRSAIFAVLYYCQKKQLPCSFEGLTEVFGIKKSTASDVLATGRPRRLQHSDEVDNRGRLPQLSGESANAIASYIDDCELDEKALSWEELQRLARVATAPEHSAETYHRTTLWRRVNEVSGIKTCKAAIKEELPIHIQTQRVNWCNEQLRRRPNHQNWRSVIWSDELHWTTGPRYAKLIERRPNERFLPKNIQYNKGERPKNNAEKGQEQDLNKEQKFHIFTVVGWSFRWAIQYDAGNSNGKMNAETFLKILPLLHEAMLGQDRVLYLDLDSAHCSARVLNWMDQNGMEYILGAPSSPDLSIMETWVKPLRQKFFQKRCNSAARGVQRFYEVWRQLDHEKINKTFASYPKRLHDCIHVYEGRMTKY